MADPTLSKKRYVPIMEAARISGYTREYIERLCRIGKIPCRIMGEKNIVELDALLSQTGTILLGGEHVGFIELDDSSPYPLVIPSGEASVPPPEVAEKTASRFGRIAVVGETIHADDGESVPQPKGVMAVPAPAGQAGEKFPTNALPFFSSMGKGGKKTGGIHIAVSMDGTAPVRSSIIPAREKQAVHLSVATDDNPPPRSSSVKAVSVMPREMPSGFVPTIPQAPVTQTTPLPVPPQVTPMASGGAAPQHAHDHDLMGYTSKLPMLIAPLSLSKKALLAVFAVGLFVAPTALGIGNALSDFLSDFGGALHSGAHGAMAAVGLIDPSRDVALFPYLEETSRLLSASGASGNTQTQTTQNGVVVTPSTGNQGTDQAIKDSIQKTFSDPVEVIPDGKDGQSGIIRPVFQKNNGTGYIYMMVPVHN